MNEKKVPCINERVKELRTTLGMTQEEFGKRIGLSKSGISSIENGNRSVTDKHIKLISNEFNINEAWLKTGEDSIKKLANEVKNLDQFKKYLQSLGYKMEVHKTGQSESGYYEEHKDEEGNILRNSFIPDEEYFSVILTKDNSTTEFNNEEFKEFQSTIEKSIEFEVFKQNQKDK